jgi:hypothetical protein
MVKHKVVLIWALFLIMARAVLDWLDGYWTLILLIVLLATLLFALGMHTPQPCYLQPNDADHPLLRI